VREAIIDPGGVLLADLRIAPEVVESVLAAVD
jgi:hypothetical protein